MFFRFAITYLLMCRNQPKQSKGQGSCRGKVEVVGDVDLRPFDYVASGVHNYQMSETQKNLLQKDYKVKVLYI